MSVFAQNAPQPEAANPEEPVQVDCARPKNERERYSCFIETQNRNLSRAAETQTQRQEAQKIVVERMVQRDTTVIQQRLQKQLELQSVVERSRKRNVSKKGQSYQVTYGRVTEPRLLP